VIGAGGELGWVGAGAGAGAATGTAGSTGGEMSSVSDPAGLPELSLEMMFRMDGGRFNDSGAGSGGSGGPPLPIAKAPRAVIPPALAPSTLGCVR